MTRSLTKRTRATIRSVSMRVREQDFGYIDNVACEQSTSMRPRIQFNCSLSQSGVRKAQYEQRLDCFASANLAPLLSVIRGLVSTRRSLTAIQKTAMQHIRSIREAASCSFSKLYHHVAKLALTAIDHAGCCDKTPGGGWQKETRSCKVKKGLW